jgi:hypothetical protein
MHVVAGARNGAIQHTFGRDGVEYGMLTKVYAKSILPENRYAPPVCILAKKTPVWDSQTLTSFARHTLNIRISTPGFSIADLQG